MLIESLTHTTTEITMEVALGVSYVGQVVTVGRHQYTVHSVEGVDWYTFERNGVVSLDLGLTRSMWVREPQATILPMGTTIGEGYSQNVPVVQLKRGVCLLKSYR